MVRLWFESSERGIMGGMAVGLGAGRRLTVGERHEQDCGWERLMSPHCRETPPTSSELEHLGHSFCCCSVRLWDF